MNVSYIRVGNDPAEYTNKNQIVKNKVHEGGFFELNQILEARYLTVRRNKSPYPAFFSHGLM